MQKENGFELNTIPYKGGGPLYQDALAGVTDLSVTSLANMMPHVSAGKLKLIGVTGDKRSKLAPNVATLAEQGIKAMPSFSWWGVYAPAGTPKPIVERMLAEIAKAVRAPDVTQKFVDQFDMEITLPPPDQFAAFVAKEQELWGKVIKDNSLKPNKRSILRRRSFCSSLTSARSCRPASRPGRSGDGGGSRPPGRAAWRSPRRDRRYRSRHRISATRARRARRRLASSGRRRSERAANRISSICRSGARPSGSWRLRSAVRSAATKSAGVAMARQQVAMVLERPIDVVLQHGDDQLVLVVEIRIEGAARQPGGGRDRLDAGRTDALLLEDLGGGLEQLFPRFLAGRSGSHS